MNTPAPLTKDILVALGVATFIVFAILTGVVRLLRRKPFEGEPR